MSRSGNSSTKSDANAAVPAAVGEASTWDRIAAATTRELKNLLTAPLPPGLYIVATPIGHLGDMTLRSIATLAQADVIYCEDTRHSRILMERFAINSPLRPYHEHNAAALRPAILKELQNGRRIALISDAGTPLVSDPGFKLVRDAAMEGAEVVSIPGASAVLTALTSSGLPSDAFFFAGFLPAKQGQRRKRLEHLKTIEATLILFESPTRLPETLVDAHAVFGNRPAAVGRELTKLHEEVSRGPLDKLLGKYANAKVKGECVLVIAGHGPQELTDQEIQERLVALLETETVKDASRQVADELKITKGRVYDLALKLKSEVSGG
jgi:16S rRNA (cytidine1402-2'-O)-methyltransferase